MTTEPPPDLCERLMAWGHTAKWAGQTADAELLIGAADEIHRLRQAQEHSTSPPDIIDRLADARATLAEAAGEIRRMRTHPDGEPDPWRDRYKAECRRYYEALKTIQVEAELCSAFGKKGTIYQVASRALDGAKERP